MTETTWFRQLRDLARVAMAEADGDWADAKRRLQKKFDGDPALLKQFLGAIVAWVIDDLVEERGRGSRKAFWTRSADDSGELNVSARKAIGTMGMAVHNLLNYPLRSGLRLGDATRPDLKVESQHLTRQARTELERARWFDLIIEKLKSDKIKVKTVLDHAALARLQDEARQAVAS